ncbi:MAG: hypothetical protein HWE34_11585 [Methylocystaceae bacterium]|nr:hypothetical protein [Methylocystaceae bacterium]
MRKLKIFAIFMLLNAVNAETYVESAYPYPDGNFMVYLEIEEGVSVAEISVRNPVHPLFDDGFYQNKDFYTVAKNINGRALVSIGFLSDMQIKIDSRVFDFYSSDELGLLAMDFDFNKFDRPTIFLVYGGGLRMICPDIEDETIIAVCNSSQPKELSGFIIEQENRDEDWGYKFGF